MSSSVLLADALATLLNVMEQPPERNCSCHVAPPCGDCVLYGGLREAVTNGYAALAEHELPAIGDPVPAPCALDVVPPVPRLADAVLEAVVPTVKVPAEPPFPAKHIATGVRSVNGVATRVFLGWTDEGGGWHQWGTERRTAKQFDTPTAAMAAARSCPGPWFNEPAKTTLATEVVDSPRATRYRAAIAAGLDAMRDPNVFALPPPPPPPAPPPVNHDHDHGSFQRVHAPASEHRGSDFADGYGGSQTRHTGPRIGA